MHLWFATGKFEGLKKELTFILLRAVSKKFSLVRLRFWQSSYFIFDIKTKIPDAFVSTTFKKHYSEIINERREKDEFSSLFYYLPSITDRKEEVNEHHGNVNLSPVDCSLSLSFCY